MSKCSKLNEEFLGKWIVLWIVLPVVVGLGKIQIPKQ